MQDHPRPRPAARRAALAAAALVAAVAAGGCRATTTTAVAYHDDRPPEVAVTLELTGEARDVVADDPGLRSRIDAAVARRFPGARAESTDDALRWSVATAPAAVTAAQGVTGVAALELGPADAPSVRAQVVVPAELVAAIEASEDPAAVPALKDNVHVGVRVEFAHGAASVDPGGLPVRTVGDTVECSQPLTGFRTGTLVATGDAPPGFPFGALAAAVVLLGVTAGLVVLARRPRPDPEWGPAGGR